MSYKHETGHFQVPLNSTKKGNSDGKELKLFYQRWIPNNVPPKPGCDLVIHHGLGEHSDRYGNVLSVLEDTGITIYTYDVRGCGRSEGKPGHAEDLFHLAEDLGVFLEFIDKEHKVTKPILYGNSMGGATVLTFIGVSKENQERAKAVVATGAALGVEKNCYQTTMSGLLSCLRGVVPNVCLDAGLDNKKLSRDQNVVEAFNGDTMTHPMIAVGLAFSLLESGRKEIIPTAKTVTLPIFLAHGGADVITDPKGSEEYYENCASTKKTLKIYPDLLHEIHNELKEDKEKVLADIKQFITENMS
ncbi:Monoglyceride lipase [Seminavis robusta]|uniref:Monoglyceride lipase n=1 Tax=Seminavis robusta TaxID=568900 RepID=A0A9N8H624_9STRA|nr:Monoglyceride lipase [Seminavis robusta]|eukprot:Sro35_g022310.1 Monoglyceride lipase (302) ;mRNA; f:68854-69759